jgi:hypothetical protein
MGQKSQIFLDLGDGTDLADRQIAAEQHSDRRRPSETSRSSSATSPTRSRLTSTGVGHTMQPLDSIGFFADHGPLSSPWTTRDELRQTESLVLNSDTLFSEAVVQAAAVAGSGTALVVSAAPETYTDDVRVRVLDAWIAGVGRELEFADHPSVGLSTVRGEEARQQFVAALDEMVRYPGNLVQRRRGMNW